MALYYYNKYNAVEEYEEGPWGSPESVSRYRPSLLRDYLLATLEGNAYYYKTYVSRAPSEPGFILSNQTRRQAGQTPAVNEYFTEGYRLYQVLSSTSVYDGKTYHQFRTKDTLTIYKRGSLVQSNIIAENGTYPTNGRHSDGYWYVRGSLVTPGTPTSITVPTEIKGGTTITISWGTSSNSDSFRLERQLNGGSWSQIYSGTARSYSDTIPKGTISVAYRVRGANGTAYSSYRTSPTITVKNFPEMWIRVNGALKTSDAGWVKVNGQLREIDTMWVRINGVIKEVQ